LKFFVPFDPFVPFVVHEGVKTAERYSTSPVGARPTIGFRLRAGALRRDRPSTSKAYSISRSGSRSSSVGCGGGGGQICARSGSRCLAQPADSVAGARRYESMLGRLFDFAEDVTTLRPAHADSARRISAGVPSGRRKRDTCCRGWR
jgi:hypothetical protein